jgi:hypothetical protein
LLLVIKVLDALEDPVSAAAASKQMQMLWSKQACHDLQPTQYAPGLILAAQMVAEGPEGAGCPTSVSAVQHSSTVAVIPGRSRTTVLFGVTLQLMVHQYILDNKMRRARAY